MRKIWIFVVAVTCVLFTTLHADAHAIGLSRGEYRATEKATESGMGTTLDATLTFARGDVIALVPSLDANHDGTLTAEEVDAAKTDIGRVMLDGIVVAGCEKTLTRTALTDQDGLAVEVRVSCAKANATQNARTSATADATKTTGANAARALDVTLPILAELPFGHRHFAHLVGATSSDEVLYRAHDGFSITPRNAEKTSAGATSSTSNTTSNASATPAEKSSTGVLGFFRMGLEHILTGYDHLVFLFGLVLVRGKFRSMLAVVSAFTFAHSLTLGVAVMGWFTPSAKIVEPAIALSIAYVGIENFFVKSAEGRWRITMPFGLIHGFGFASALRELELPAAKVPVALVSFNLGVEAGQLAVMAVLLPVVYLVREKTAFSMRGMKVLSTCVALAGAIWFVARIAA